MKTNARYGSLKLSAKVTREIQLEWDMVETTRTMPRFLNFPCIGAAMQPPRRRRASEKRPLAA